MRCDSAGFKEIMNIAQKCISLFKILLSNKKNYKNQDESNGYILDNIEKLAKLESEGILSKDEFQIKKKELLSRLK